MWAKIEKFRSIWLPRSNQGKFQFLLVNNATWNLEADSPAEFAAIIALLNENQVFLNTANGAIATGPEPTGDNNFN
ncbi:MAG: hypothetical protein AB1489_43230 [Acidobacteriota bacterium]